MPDNLQQRLHLCLQVEVAAGVESPAEYADARMEYQVLDDSAPLLAAPAGLVRRTGPGSTESGVRLTTAELGEATASDACGAVQVSVSGTPPDGLYPIGITELVWTAIDAAGKTVEHYEYPGDDHNLSASFAAAMSRSVAFFDAYVKGP